MKLMIASDLHGSAFYAGSCLPPWSASSRTSCCCWGIFYTTVPATTCPEGYAPKEVIAMLNPLRERLLCVRGNCDTEVDQMVLDFPILADYALLYAGSRTVFATHGHHYNTACPPPLAKGDILLHGHTHVPAWQEFGSGNLYLNPGSVAIPKENSAHSYMMLTDSGFAWKDLEGSIYHTLALDCPNCG